MSDVFLVHFIITTLPSQYGPFKISYNTYKDKWTIDNILIMCEEEEARLTLEMEENAMMVTQGKKIGQIKGKGKGKSNKILASIKCPSVFSVKRMDI